jgi:hypothetical protein
MTKPLRQKMPTVAAFIDDLRAAFGEEIIHNIIRAGLQGQPVFHASENGHQIGTPLPSVAGKSVSMADIDLRSFSAIAAQHASRAKGK